MHEALIGHFTLIIQTEAIFYLQKMFPQFNDWRILKKFEIKGHTRTKWVEDIILKAEEEFFARLTFIISAHLLFQSLVDQKFCFIRY